MLNIYIGFDSREPAAYHVLSHSLLRQASSPIAIHPLVRTQLAQEYTRPRGPLESTDFSMTRFLVPFLSNYRGYSIFMDCDMLMRTDIHRVMEDVGRDPFHALWVCQHDYTPKSYRKFLNQEQTKYPRKNWSSFIVFNNSACRQLTPAYVNNAPGLDLHRFTWLPDDLLGSLPLEWNWLVGEYPPNPHAWNWHYTQGGPWFPEYAACDHADEWRTERALMLGEN